MNTMSTRIAPDTLTLPDGRKFAKWEPVLKFSKTYYVDGQAAGACDCNPGTKEQPFRTIGKAAQVLKPGERVVVAAGMYREYICPARGGTGPARMISYQAAPGAKVVVRGSEVVTTEWKPADGKKRTWKLALADYFGGVKQHPFNTPNVSGTQFDIMPWAEGLRKLTPYSLACGLVFQQGRRLEQANDRAQMARTAGMYWVDMQAGVLYVRPLGGKNPNKVTMEITTRPYLLAPETMGLGYVHVKGFTFEQAGNPYPMPQYGAVSSTRGHHWVIEGNTVRQVNGVGVDIANQHPSLPQPKIKPADHILRGNTITDCGVSGVQGLGTIRCLIEDNTIADCCFHDAEQMFESAGIKTHFTTDTVIRGNRVLRTQRGSGIWIDAANDNSRVTGNVVVDTKTMFGGIFVEISDKTSMVDHNVVWNTKGAGLYEHDTDSQIWRDNFVGRSTGAAMWFRGAVTGRQVGKNKLVGGRHTILDNILFENGQNLVTENPQRLVQGTVTCGIKAKFNYKTLTVSW